LDKSAAAGLSLGPGWEIFLVPKLQLGNPNFRQSSCFAALIDKIISFDYAMLPKQELGNES